LGTPAEAALRQRGDAEKSKEPFRPMDRGIFTRAAEGMNHGKAWCGGGAGRKRRIYGFPTMTQYFLTGRQFGQRKKQIEGIGR
jgi:hypothetical protein